MRGGIRLLLAAASPSTPLLGMMAGDAEFWRFYERYAAAQDKDAAWEACGEKGYLYALYLDELERLERSQRERDKKNN